VPVRGEGYGRAVTGDTAVRGLLLLVVAAVLGRLVHRHLPELVGYLVAGALLGPSAAHLIDRSDLHDLRGLTVAATALLMVLIGRRLSIGSFRSAPWIAPVAVVGYAVTSLAVLAAMRAAGATTTLAAIVAVLAGGGAPMTVASIVRREDATGAWPRALIGLHASCDVIVSLVFAIAFPVAVVENGMQVSFGDVALQVARLGAAGAALGLGLGVSMRFVGGRLRSRRAVLAVGVAHLAVVAGLSWAAGLSTPLAALALGAVVGSAPANDPARLLFVPIRWIEPGLYVLFFAFAGAAIRFNALPEFGAIGAVYVAARFAAKVGSGVLGGRLASLPARAGLQIGLGSLPHAGVSAALAAAASAALPGRGIATITLTGIVLFEVAGSLIVRGQLRGEPVALAAEA